MGWRDAPLVEEPKWKSAPLVEQPPKTSMFRSFTQGMSDIGSFGFDDELRGFGRAAGSKIRGDERPFSELNRIGHQEVENENKKIQSDNPGSYLSGQIAGAVIPAFSAPGTAISDWANVGRVGARAAKGGGVAALSAGLYGAGSGEGGVVDRAENAAPYAIAGGAFGAGLPLAGAAVKAGADALIPKASETGAQALKLAQKYNIPLGIDDITDSPFYKTLISEGKNIPFSGSGTKGVEQNKAFTRAVAKSVGMDTDKLTVEAIDDAFTNVGKEFDDLTKGKTFTINDDVAHGLNEILSVAENGGYGAEGTKLFAKYVKDLGAVTDMNGQVPGEVLSKVRGQLNAVGRKGSDPNAKAIARDLEGAISDFITDGSPGALKQAKYRYKNLIAIEPLAAKDQLGGQISPAQLLGRVRQVYKRQFSRGNAGELGDLANVGQFIKESVPNSGTSQRTMAKNLLTGNALGSVPTYIFGGPVAAAAQLGASGLAMGANRAIQNRNFDQKALALALQKGAETKALPKTSALAKILQKGSK